MPEVVFVDTSVLLNILDVPRKNSDKEDVLTEFKRLITADCLLIVPIAAVIEVGNHVARLPGDVARDRTTRFVNFLRSALLGQRPWVVSGAAWDISFLQALLEGNGRPDLIGFVSQGIG